MMRKDITLYVPKLEELDYRQKILSQEGTMSYNKGHDINNKNYHKETGCIDFPNSEWESWYKAWVTNKPERFYAYIKRSTDKKFIGEVNLHFDAEHDWYEMGIVIEENCRGNCYSVAAVKSLLKIAFEEFNANGVHNNFEYNRHNAIQAHVDAGFRIIDNYEGFVDVYISKTQYLDSLESNKS